RDQRRPQPPTSGAWGERGSVAIESTKLTPVAFRPWNAMAGPELAGCTRPFLVAVLNFTLGCHARNVAAPLFRSCISLMLWRSSRGRPLNAPAAFIHPCQPNNLFD